MMSRTKIGEMYNFELWHVGYAHGEVLQPLVSNAATYRAWWARPDFHSSKSVCGSTLGHWSCSPVHKFPIIFGLMPLGCQHTPWVWPIPFCPLEPQFLLSSETNERSQNECNDDTCLAVFLCSIIPCLHARLGDTQQVRHHLLSAVGWLPVMVRGSNQKRIKRSFLGLIKKSKDHQVSYPMGSVVFTHSMCMYILQPPSWFTLGTPSQQWRARLVMMIPTMTLVAMSIYHLWTPSVNPKHWRKILGPIYIYVWLNTPHLHELSISFTP